MSPFFEVSRKYLLSRRVTAWEFQPRIGFPASATILPNLSLKEAREHRPLLPYRPILLARWRRDRRAGSGILIEESPPNRLSPLAGSRHAASPVCSLAFAVGYNSRSS